MPTPAIRQQALHADSMVTRSISMEVSVAKPVASKMKGDHTRLPSSAPPRISWMHWSGFECQHSIGLVGGPMDAQARVE